MNSVEQIFKAKIEDHSVSESTGQTSISRRTIKGVTPPSNQPYAPNGGQVQPRKPVSSVTRKKTENQNSYIYTVDMYVYVNSDIKNSDIQLWHENRTGSNGSYLHFTVKCFNSPVQPITNVKLIHLRGSVTINFKYTKADLLNMVIPANESIYLNSNNDSETNENPKTSRGTEIVVSGDDDM